MYYFTLVTFFYLFILWKQFYNDNIAIIYSINETHEPKQKKKTV